MNRGEGWEPCPGAAYFIQGFANGAMAQSDPDLSTNQQALPPLSREALHRIEQAETDARERYDRDKMPYFPTSPGFKFFEVDIVQARGRILEYLRLFAAEVLDAHLLGNTSRLTRWPC
jgi:hypothetical protein